MNNSVRTSPPNYWHWCETDRSSRKPGFVKTIPIGSRHQRSADCLKPHDDHRLNITARSATSASANRPRSAPSAAKTWTGPRLVSSSTASDKPNARPTHHRLAQVIQPNVGFKKRSDETKNNATDKLPEGARRWHSLVSCLNLETLHRFANEW